MARRLRLCGTMAQVRTCGGCGDPHARVEVSATCDVRACPLCARRRATRETHRIGGAAARVAGYVAARREASRLEVERELAEREAQTRRTRARDRDCGRLRGQLADLRAEARGGWRWRLVTLSPPWRPSDPREYSVASLRRRLVELRAAGGRVWELLGVGGRAGAYVRVELSAGGHVHCHALVYGPWRSQRALQRRAGLMVDVRLARGNALREVVKYALKAPSPRGAWLAGESSPVAHPALAAAWTVATKGRRLVEPFGVMRDAVHAEDAAAEDGDSAAAGERAEGPARCATCGSQDLDEGRARPLRDVARECLQLGKARWTLRPTPHPRGDGSPLGALVLPARVVIGCGPSRPQGDGR